MFLKILDCVPNHVSYHIGHCFRKRKKTVIYIILKRIDIFSQELKGIVDFISSIYAQFGLDISVPGNQRLP